ncbi:hypothetical protein ACET3Z_032184 [Daucus carota]
MEMLKNDDEDDCPEMLEAIRSVEQILNYKFKDQQLLEKALTHPSYTKSESYERLEIVGDAALGLAIINFAYIAYPHHNPGVLSLIRAANISTEKLARVAISSGFYKYVRHNSPSLDYKVKKFTELVQQEEDITIYGGEMKAPKVLADIVESVVGAVYEDLCFDLKATWLVVGGLLEPIITPQMLQKKPQPVSQLFELCQKNGQQVDIKQSRENDKTTASIYIDKKLIVSASSDQKDNAKLHAATAALERTIQPTSEMDIRSSFSENGMIGTAKRKLEQFSLKKKWAKPTYRLVREEGPNHAKTYVCSVSLKVGDYLFCQEGEVKSRLKDAEDPLRVIQTDNSNEDLKEHLAEE